MPGRLAELAHVSARLRATMEKDATILSSAGKWAVNNPGKAALGLGGAALAGNAGVNKARSTRATFQPAIRDEAMGLSRSTP